MLYLPATTPFRSTAVQYGTLNLGRPAYKIHHPLRVAFCQALQYRSIGVRRYSPSTCLTHFCVFFQTINCGISRALQPADLQYLGSDWIALTSQVLLSYFVWVLSAVSCYILQRGDRPPVIPAKPLEQPAVLRHDILSVLPPCQALSIMPHRGI